MSNGSKIVAISAVALLGVAGVYYIASTPSASNNKSSTTAKESGAPSTTGAVASNNQTNMPPTLTLTPTVPGTASTSGTATNAAGAGTSPTPTGTMANAGARSQPPFVPGAATNAGTGKGDVPSGTTTNGVPGTNGFSNTNGAAIATNTNPSTGATSPGVGSPTNTAAPRIVNGITIPASGSASGSATNSGATNSGASGAGAPTTTSGGTNIATGSPTPTGAGLPTGSTPTGLTAGGFGATGSSGSSSGTPTTGASSSNSERTHVIASGDTFEALAQKYFNDSTKWQLIAKANPTVEPERLKIGQKIRIPAGGSTATLAADTSAQSVTSPARSTGATGGNLHTVAKGDTPSSISRKYYGSDKYWRQILAANKGATEKNLKVGQKLTIPAKDTIVGAETVGGRGS